jgi:maleate isomerase
MTLNIAVRHIEPVNDNGMAKNIVIGLITLSTDILSENELRLMMPQSGVVLSSTRIITHNPMTVANLAAHATEIAAAAALFTPIESVNVFIYACTSGSAIISQQSLEKDLHSQFPNARLTSPMTGAINAFKRMGISRISLLAPYPDDVIEPMIACLEREGVVVVSAASFHIEDDLDVLKVSPDCIMQSAISLDCSESQAVFIPCTGMRTSSIIQSLEDALQKPVITAHQAMLWDALEIAGYNGRITGYGRIFET